MDSLSERNNDPPVRSAGPWLALLAAFLGWMFDGVELGLFPLTARPALRELMGASLTPRQLADRIGLWMGWIGAATLIGAAFGGVLFGWLGDRIGRVRALAWAVAVYSLISGLCAFVHAPLHLAALRFGAALGMGGEWAVGTALVMEVWPTRLRPYLAAAIGAASNIGYLLIALLGLALGQFIAQAGTVLHSLHVPHAWAQELLANSGWRMLYLAGALPALLTFLVRLFVPESERWQHSNRTARHDNHVSEIFRPGLLRLTLLGTALSGIALLGTWGSVQWVASWAEKLQQHAGPAAAAAARSQTQIANSLGAVIACVLATPLLRGVSRRVGYFTLSLASLLACAALFRGGLPFGHSFLAEVFIVGGITAAFFAWLPLYLPELFPTRIRATGQGFTYNAGRVIAAAGTLCSGALLSGFGEDYGRMCAWISLIYAAGLIVIWFCPETRGKPLPE